MTRLVLDNLGLLLIRTFRGALFSTASLFSFIGIFMFLPLQVSGPSFDFDRDDARVIDGLRWRVVDGFIGGLYGGVRDDLRLLRFRK